MAMGFSHIKNLGLASLVLILVAICVAALWQTHTVNRYLGQVEGKYLPSVSAIYPIDRMLENAHNRFHDYHTGGRVLYSEVITPFIELHSTVAELKPLSGEAAEEVSTYQWQVKATEANFRALADLMETNDQPGKTALGQQQAELPGLTHLRVQLRGLALKIPTERRDAARMILQRASSLLRIAEDMVNKFFTQGPSEIPSVIQSIDHAGARLGDLLDLGLSETLGDKISILKEDLAHLRSLVHTYGDDAKEVEGDASSDLLDGLHGRIHEKWLKARTASAWITRNLHREVWLTTTSAVTATRRGELALLLLGIVGVAIATTTALVLSRRLTCHVSTVAEATTRFAQGDYTERLPASGSDEMAGLETSLNRMADQLERREADLGRLAAAVEHAADGILIATPDGIVEYLNPAFRDISGCNGDEWIGLDLRTLEDKPDAPAWIRQLREVGSNGDPNTGRYSTQRNDGSPYQELCTIYPALGPDGGIGHLVVSIRDVSREVQIEERVKESQKLQALGTLAGGIAHDFNNLLVPILGYSEMLMAGTPHDQPAYRRLERIANAAERAKELVEQVLTFSRAGEKEKRPLQLSSLVKEVVKLVGTTIPSNIQVRLSVDAALPPILADPVQIHQALMNLLTNAVHSMEPIGGHLAIRVEPSPSRATDDTTGQVCLSIRDTGCGMDTDLVERIFEPFFTTKGVGKGTGLGLSVVHGIVESHGGRIEVESDPGIGSCFRLYFPASISGTAPLPAKGELSAKGSARVLLVEDEPAVAEVLQAALEELGYRVVSTDSAIHALELLHASAEEFDVVVTDQRMPGMTGIELIAALREEHPDLPVVLCTGYYVDADGSDPGTSGATEILYKPVHPNELGHAVRRLACLKSQTAEQPRES